MSPNIYASLWTPVLQSAYRPHHSTEIFGDICISMGHIQEVILCLLGTVKHDTVKHATLFQRLHDIGMKNSAHYLTDRTIPIKVHSYGSPSFRDVVYGALQGSYHMHVDTTQLYMESIQDKMSWLSGNWRQYSVCHFINSSTIWTSVTFYFIVCSVSLNFMLSNVICFSLHTLLWDLQSQIRVIM